MYAFSLLDHRVCVCRVQNPYGTDLKIYERLKKKKTPSFPLKRQTTRPQHYTRIRFFGPNHYILMIIINSKENV